MRTGQNRSPRRHELEQPRGSERTEPGVRLRCRVTPLERVKGSERDSCDVTIDLSRAVGSRFPIILLTLPYSAMSFITPQARRPCWRRPAVSSGRKAASSSTKTRPGPGSIDCSAGGTNASGWREPGVVAFAPTPAGARFSRDSVSICCSPAPSRVSAISATLFRGPCTCSTRMGEHRLRLNIPSSRSQPARCRADCCSRRRPS
jgi:hypothetical protein